MPQLTPSLEAEFRTRVTAAIRLAEIGEVARFEAAAGSQSRRNLHPARIELLYELAYLRIFVSWEAFLEQVFLRYLCGHVSARGPVVLATGISAIRTIADAEAAVLGNRRFVLWHDPQKVIARSKRFFTKCPIETIVLSNATRLEHLASVRHRITHSQKDARRRFDKATMLIAGKRYRGARPGSFLRDVDTTGTPPQQWIKQLGAELQGLAKQIA